MSSPSLRDVLERHTPELLALPGVTGTGEGVEGGEAVVVVFVLEKTPELARRIPRRIEGHPVILRETGEVRPLRP